MAFLAVGALPSDAAGSLQWKDAAGDAGLSGLPFPSDDLDITAVRIEAKGDMITWTADIKQIGSGAPSAATGMQYVFEFSYQDTAFTAAIIDDTLYGKRTELRGGPDASTGTLPCSRCLGTVDRKASKAILKTPIASLSGGMRSVDRSFPEFKKGSQLDHVVAVSNRMWGVYNETAGGANLKQPSDEAPAPDEGIFAI
jgi:hypothetical protein